jgi:CBS domain-containing protein
MLISDILRFKGSEVVTIAPDASMTTLLAELASHNIGALVVRREGKVVGIVSERDIVRRLHVRGHEVLDGTVEQIMTTNVIACAPSDQVDQVANAMTEKRVRHLPVIDGDQLVGIVTIGDVVLSRTRQLEQDRLQLEQYITG